MKTVDLFCGCGGMSLGFSAAGFNIVGAIDFWDAALDVYRENIHGHPAIKHDLSDTEKAEIIVKNFQPEAIIGGPPCQDFSQAGKRIEGTKADLTHAYAKIVSAVKPTWFIMENVERAKDSQAFRKARDILSKSGYGISERVLDASLCGVPQKRKRFFCIGKLGETDGFMDTELDSALAKTPLSVREYMGNELDFDTYYRHPRNYQRRGIFSIDEPSATIRGVNRPIPPSYKKHPNDCGNPENVRPLTTEERSRIQTFPKGYKWLGSKSAQEQMIGNAVPVNLAAFVGQCITEFLERE